MERVLDTFYERKFHDGRHIMHQSSMGSWYAMDNTTYPTMFVVSQLIIRGSGYVTS